MGYLWPEIFTNPSMFYNEDIGAHERKGAALADTLTGWGLCMAQAVVPETFGEAMAKLGEITGCATADEAMKTAKTWLSS